MSEGGQVKPRGKSGNPRLKHPGGAQANATKERLNILTFKTTVCTNESHHDWSRCKFYHNSKDRRRKLASGYYYYPDDVQNDIEFVYHPMIYKTQPCPEFHKKSACSRGVFCAKAHGAEELRSAREAKAAGGLGVHKQGKHSGMDLSQFAAYALEQSSAKALLPSWEGDISDAFLKKTAVWACEACSFHNSASVEKDDCCAMCGTRRLIVSTVKALKSTTVSLSKQSERRGSFRVD